MLWVLKCWLCVDLSDSRTKISESFATATQATVKRNYGGTAAGGDI